MTQNPPDDGLTAFGSTCPTANEVTNVLEQLGFRLTFQMQAMMYPAYSNTASLPAQYHYRDAANTDVIFLAGRDPDQEGVRLPPHAARWWLYPGHDQEAAHEIAYWLGEYWSLTWRHDHSLRQAA